MGTLTRPDRHDEPLGDRRGLHRRDDGAGQDGDGHGVADGPGGSGSASTSDRAGPAVRTVYEAFEADARASTFSGPASSGTTSTCKETIVPLKVWDTLRHREVGAVLPQLPGVRGPRRHDGGRSDRIRTGRRRERLSSSAPLPARSPPACRVVQTCFKTNAPLVRDLPRTPATDRPRVPRERRAPPTPRSERIRR